MSFRLLAAAGAVSDSAAASAARAGLAEQRGLRKGGGEMVVYVRHRGEVHSVEVDAGASLPDLAALCATACGMLSVRLALGGEELCGAGAIADSGLCSEAILDVLGGAFRWAAHHPELIEVEEYVAVRCAPRREFGGTRQMAGAAECRMVGRRGAWPADDGRPRYATAVAEPALPTDVASRWRVRLDALPQQAGCGVGVLPLNPGGHRGQIEDVAGLGARGLGWAFCSSGALYHDGRRVGHNPDPRYWLKSGHVLDLEYDPRSAILRLWVNGVLQESHFKDVHGDGRELRPAVSFSGYGLGSRAALLDA